MTTRNIDCLVEEHERRRLRLLYHVGETTTVHGLGLLWLRDPSADGEEKIEDQRWWSQRKTAVSLQQPYRCERKEHQDWYEQNQVTLLHSYGQHAEANQRIFLHSNTHHEDWDDYDSWNDDEATQQSGHRNETDENDGDQVMHDDEHCDDDDNNVMIDID